MLIGADNDPAVNPSFNLVSAVSVRMPDVIFVPSGSVMDVSFQNTTFPMSLSIVVQDAIPNLSPTG
jgi:hypothetical protein